MKKIKNILNAVCFLLLASFIFITLNDLGRGSVLQYQKLALHDTFEENSIKIAFVGSSSSFRYYNPMYIWDEYGITSAAYQNGSLPTELIDNMINYLCDYQSPDLVTIDLRSMISDENSQKMLGMTNTNKMKEAYTDTLKMFPVSNNRYLSIDGTNMFENEKYINFFSIFHNNNDNFENINYLSSNNFSVSPTNFLGSGSNLFKTTDVTKNYVDYTDFDVDTSYELTQLTKNNLDIIFNAIEQNNLNVLFTFTPYVISRSSYDPEIRYAIGQYIMENGYHFYDMRNKFEEIGLETDSDFYDELHVNILGSEKYSQHIMNYIEDNFEISKNHSQETTNLWNSHLEQWIPYKEKSLEKLFLEIESEENDDNS